MTAPLIASLDIAGRDCLVVGGGRRALATVQRLLDSDAVVTVVAPRLHATLRTQLAASAIRHHATTFAPAQLAGMCLAVPATGDRIIDGAVRMAADVRGIPAACVDDAAPAPRLRRAAGSLSIHPAPAARGEGRVDLVGAGPGCPGLLTVDALLAIARADAVLHDRLVPQAILDLAPPGAERCYFGKARARHSVAQQTLNEMLVARAHKGQRVVRLKGGDPYLFGRGGEEAAKLTAEGIPVGVIPGISAAGGCAAYAGIPLTHREHAHSCQFVTVHRRAGAVDMDWPALVRPRQTLALYMGLQGLPEVSAGLIAAGMPPDTPAAIVENGTRPEQRVLSGTIATLPAVARRHRVVSPAMTIVGEVVRLHATLAPDAVRPAITEVAE